MRRPCRNRHHGAHAAPAVSRPLNRSACARPLHDSRRARRRARVVNKRADLGRLNGSEPIARGAPGSASAGRRPRASHVRCAESWARSQRTPPGRAPARWLEPAARAERQPARPHRSPRPGRPGGSHSRRPAPRQSGRRKFWPSTRRRSALCARVPMGTAENRVDRPCYHGMKANRESCFGGAPRG
jgi:hypothetical protein